MLNGDLKTFFGETLTSTPKLQEPVWLVSTFTRIGFKHQRPGNWKPQEEEQEEEAI